MSYAGVVPLKYLEWRVTVKADSVAAYTRLDQAFPLLRGLRWGKRRISSFAGSECRQTRRVYRVMKSREQLYRDVCRPTVAKQAQFALALLESPFCESPAIPLYLVRMLDKVATQFRATSLKCANSVTGRRRPWSCFVKRLRPRSCLFDLRWGGEVLCPRQRLSLSRMKYSV